MKWAAFGCMGLALSAGALALFHAPLSLLLNGVSARGVITSVSRDTVTYRFADVAEPDEAYQGQAPARAFSDPRIGRKVRIRYLASNPDVSQPPRPWPVWATLALVWAASLLIISLAAPRGDIDELPEIARLNPDEEGSTQQSAGGDAQDRTPQP